jgi:hypothetical protein
MPENRPPRSRASRRKPRRAVRLIVTAVALGLLVVAVSVVVSIVTSGPATPPGSTSTAAAGQADYDAALAAVAAGETTKAADLLAAAAAAGNDAAQTKLDEIEKGTKPPAADAYTKAAADVGVFLPASMPGYDMSLVETSAASAIVSAQPSIGGASQGKVQIIVLTVLDKDTPEGAVAWLTRFPEGYPKNAADVTVGSLAGRFGTDGLHLAAVAFVRGRYAFEVVTTAAKGKPIDLKALTVEAAATFAATKSAP